MSDNRKKYPPEKVNEWMTRYRAKLLVRLKDLKNSLGCADCGERHPAVLDWHHRNPSTKVRRGRGAPGPGSLSAWGWKRMLKEVELCTVLCANCHRKRHADDA